MHVKNAPESPAHVNPGSGVDRLINSIEARQILGNISESKFRALTKSGDLPAQKQGTYVYVRESVIRAYIDALPPAAEDSAA